MKNESSAPAPVLADCPSPALVPSPAPVVEYSPRQVKTKVSEIVKKRRDGTENVFWEVRVGSVAAKVYYTPHGHRDFFTVSYSVDGKRKRVLLPTKEAAIEAAKGKCRDFSSGKLVAADFSAEQLLACARALKIIAPTGLAIDEVASRYWEYYKILQNLPLIVPGADYARRHSVNALPMSVSEVKKEMLDAKKADGLSDGYLRHLRYDLDKFGKAFHGDIGAITGQAVDKWLRGLGVSPRTRNNLRNSVQTLFAFAKAKQYVGKAHDEMDFVALAKETEGEIEIYTPAEMAEMLSLAKPNLVPFLALGAFAGIRHAEIQRLEWPDINFEKGIIDIKARKAKTASRRIVPLLDNLRAWLESERKADGVVCVYSNMASELKRLERKINVTRRKTWAAANKISKKTLLATTKEVAAQRAAEQKTNGKRRTAWGTAIPKGADTAAAEGWTPFKWKHNALRHSFISYRVADKKNIAEVSLEAGNSPQMIFQHYREVVTADEGKAWFAIMPTE
jgi:integrase